MALVLFTFKPNYSRILSMTNFNSPVESSDDLNYNAHAASLRPNSPGSIHTTVHPTVSDHAERDWDDWDKDRSIYSAEDSVYWSQSLTT